LADEGKERAERQQPTAAEAVHEAAPERMAEQALEQVGGSEATGKALA
jgi:hypothetical protein